MLLFFYKGGITIKTYKKDNKKAAFISIGIIALFVIIMAMLIIFFFVSDKKYIAGILMPVVCFSFVLKFIPEVINNSAEIIEFSDKDIAFHKTRTKRIPLDKITRLEYKGVKFLPFTERMVVHSDDEKIRIDFFFINYLYVWYDIVLDLREMGYTPDVDDRILQRLHITK